MATTAPPSIKEFKLTSCELEVNKDQLIEGFQLLHTPLDVEKLISIKSVKSFFSYLKWFKNEASVNNQNKTEISEFFLAQNFHQILVRFGDYFSVYENIGHNRKSRKQKIFSTTLSLTNFLNSSSRKFCTKFFEIGGVKHMIKLLSYEEFVKEPKNTNFIHLILLNITILANEAGFYKHEWMDLDAVNVLLKVARINELFKRPAYSSVLKIANDDQISDMYEISQISSTFINSLAKAANEIRECIKNGETVKREIKEFSEDTEDKEKSKGFDVYFVVDDNNVRYPITSVINTIYKLSVNDKIKYDLYITYNVKDPLRVFLLSGSDIEKRYALKLLMQLCFDPKVQKNVSKDDDLMTLMQSHPKENFLSKSFKWLLWFFKLNKTEDEKTIDGDDFSEESGSIKQNEGDEISKKDAGNIRNQIMISYNAASRELCLKIKKVLEDIGYKVWIDVDEIAGSSLESMANAVENSEVILMCVTEKYRQSNNCQAEAQYAFKLKKPLIPLIMQENYEKVGGWLGLIMGDRIYVNFVKYEFEESINKLKSQLSKIMPIEILDEKLIEKEEIVTKKDISNTETQESPPNPIQYQLNNIVCWSDDEVKAWFEDMNCLKLYESLKPCNGELLKQLHEIWIHAPEFFYQFISLDNKLDRHTLLLFSNNLQKAFKQ